MSDPFGARLRALRLRAGLTQEALADRAGLSPRAVRAWEHGDRRPHAGNLGRIADVLALDGVERGELVAALAPPVAAAEAIGSALPTMIGRDPDVAAVEGLLARSDVRLVSVLGPGGVGKTRLARELAARSAGAAVVVELDAVRDSALVPEVAGRALGLRDAAGGAADVLAALGRLRPLLVLDNVEQLLEARSFVAQAASSGATVLVTSRVALNLPAEHRYLLGPLPDAAAAQLLVSRAREVRPDFVLGPGTASDVDTLCRRLDRLPLALEIAARWLRALTPAALLERLDDHLGERPGADDADVPARQRSLDASITWSYALLGADAQVALRQLSVFAGPFDPAAAAAVTSLAPRALLDAIVELVDTSLLQLDDTGGSLRYRMLETVRAFGRGRSAAAGEERAGRAAHVRWACALAAEAAPHLGRVDQDRSLAVCEAAHDDLRAALRWMRVHGDAREAVRTAGRLWRYWYLRGWWSEGRALLSEVLDEHRLTGDPDDPLRGPALTGLAVLLARHGDYPLAADVAAQADGLSGPDAASDGDAAFARGLSASLSGRYEQAHGHYGRALERYAAAGEPDLVGDATNYLGYALWRGGRHAQARERFAAARELFLDRGNSYGLGRTYFGIAETALDLGELDVARACFTRVRELDTPTSYLRGLAGADLGLGWVALRDGDIDCAADLLAAALDAFRRIGDRLFLASCYSGLSAVAVQRGDPRMAARLLGAVDEQATPVSYREPHADTERRVAVALDSTSFATERERGRLDARARRI